MEKRECYHCMGAGVVYRLNGRITNISSSAETCPSCNGNGVKPKQLFMDCKYCQGEGKRYDPIKEKIIKCHNCEGTGQSRIRSVTTFY